jgi:hypothetical protein
MPDVADAEPDNPQAANLELTVLMPCLNEAETVTACVRKAVGFLADHSIDGEVVVADNGSTDGSQWLAVHAGARVVSVAEPGYGSALLGGIMAQTSGMEFASETVVRATLAGQHVEEVPLCCLPR